MGKPIIQPASLPPWAKLGPRPKALQVVEVDASVAYPDLLFELGQDPAKLRDVYWVEVARNFIAWDVRVGMRDARLEIRIQDRDRKWALKNFENGNKPCPRCHGGPKSAEASGGKVYIPCRHCGGTGTMAAVRAGAKDARDHYKRLRGFRPA